MNTTENHNTPSMEEIVPLFVGIDIAKNELVVHILPTNTQLTVPNSPKGFRQLLQLFKDNPPQQILCEATGGLERLAQTAPVQGNPGDERSRPEKTPVDRHAYARDESPSASDAQGRHEEHGKADRIVKQTD